MSWPEAHVPDLQAMLPGQPTDLQRQGFHLAPVSGQRQLDLAAAGLPFALGRFDDGHLLPMIESFTEPPSCFLRSATILLSVAASFAVLGPLISIVSTYL